MNIDGNDSQEKEDTMGSIARTPTLGIGAGQSSRKDIEVSGENSEFAPLIQLGMEMGALVVV